MIRKLILEVKYSTEEDKLARRLTTSFCREFDKLSPNIYGNIYAYLNEIESAIKFSISQNQDELKNFISLS